MPKERVSENPGAVVPDADVNGLLFASHYRDLRQLAERQLRRNSSASISPTTLLHEAYLGISTKGAVFPDRERFMGYAARVMRSLIIDFVRERRALKRGGAFHFTSLSAGVVEVADRELSKVSDAIDELATREPHLAEIVDLRYFCGFTIDEIADMRGISSRTVERDWEKARLILFQQLNATS